MKSRPIIVIPYVPELLKKLRNWDLVIKAARLSEINEIIESAGSENNIVSISVGPIHGLAGIKVQENWRKTHISCELTEAGNFEDYCGNIDSFRDKLIRFYFKPTAENLISARILSSLGVSAGIIFDREMGFLAEIDDLVCYDAYTKSPHKHIEPFAYVFSHYKDPIIDYNEVYYSRSGFYVHCNKAGDLAADPEALRAGEYLGHLQEADKIQLPRLKRKDTAAVLSKFLAMSGCSVCPGWKVCGFKKTQADSGPCRFSELMDSFNSAAAYVNSTGAGK
jgi:hypothetical protein